MQYIFFKLKISTNFYKINFEYKEDDKKLRMLKLPKTKCIITILD